MISHLSQTPVQQLSNGDYVKRDDLFCPFTHPQINGGKARQALAILNAHSDEASKGVYVTAYLQSHTPPIVSLACKELGFPCHVFYGGSSPENLRKLRDPMLSYAFGAQIEIVSKAGYQTALEAEAKRRVSDSGGYIMPFNFTPFNDISTLMPCSASQCQNLPDVDTIYVTVGSGNTLCSILYGIQLHNVNVSKVIAIGCGPNRMKYIQKVSDACLEQLGTPLPLHLLDYRDVCAELPGYKYSDLKPASFDGISFSPRYEGKSFTYYLSHRDPSKRNLFWITGS